MWSIIGHVNALAALGRALESERPPHAWLFYGPEGVGKQTVALEFAAALNCTSETAPKPCGECRACRDTLAGRHPDVEVIAPGGMCDEPEHKDHADSRDLRICQVRRLERLLSLSPYTATRRVAIVDAADTLRVEAANAFLKTLEEPPAGSVIILLAEREERLPETVLSRCQRLAFRPIERESIVESLIERGAEPDEAVTIAATSGGRLGWALEAFEDRSLLDERSMMLDEALRLAHAGRAERFAWAGEAQSRQPGVRERYMRELTIWESWWRDVLLYGAGGGSEGASNPDRENTLLEEGRLYPAAQIVRFLQSMAQTREYLRENVDPQLALENLTLDMPAASRAAASNSRGR
ncbi:MAG TPA: DNA polymerase III subunit delta' [Dehalococcoidia bacterium]|nr:DNA polymerase III subunit delta' [Dehalococcoidia bacterium]